MKQYRNKILIGAALGFVVMAVTMLVSDINQIAEQAVNFPWLIMVPVLILRCANWTLRFIKWHFYLGVVGVENIRKRDSAAVFLTGFVFSLSPGKVAEVLKSFMIKGLTGTPVPQTLPVIAAERLSDGLAVLILLAVSVFALSASQYWPVFIVAMVFMVLMVAVLQSRALCLHLLDRAERLPLVNRIATELRTFYESSYEIVRWKNLFIAVSLGLLANLQDSLGVYLILVGLGLPAASVTFFQAMLVISLGVIVGSLSALPGGLGAADFSIGMVLGVVVGLITSAAGFATLLIRFVELWWGVAIGVLIGVLSRQRLFTSDLESDLAEAAAD